MQSNFKRIQKGPKISSRRKIDKIECDIGFDGIDEQRNNRIVRNSSKLKNVLF